MEKLNKKIFKEERSLDSLTDSNLVLEIIKFIQENIKYPMEALQNGVQGTVYVTFVVEKDGSLSNIRILKGIGYGCDKEVLRITKLMPKWNLGKQKAEPVRVQFNLPVHFILQG